MHGIAPTRAIPQRTASAVLFFLALCLWLAGGDRVSAQEAIYRCGQEYTNAPSDPSRCERLEALTAQAARGAPAAGLVARACARLVEGPALRRAVIEDAFAQERAAAALHHPHHAARDPRAWRADGPLHREAHGVETIVGVQRPGHSLHVAQDAFPPLELALVIPASLFSL